MDGDGVVVVASRDVGGGDEGDANDDEERDIR